MFTTKLKMATAALLAVSVLAGGAGVVTYQLLAADKPVAPAAEKPAGKEQATEGLSLAEFQNLQTQIKPRSGGFDDIPWMTSLWGARKKAATEGKPLLVWVAEGHPLGFT